MIVSVFISSRPIPQRGHLHVICIPKSPCPAPLGRAGSLQTSGCDKCTWHDSSSHTAQSLPGSTFPLYRWVYFLSAWCAWKALWDVLQVFQWVSLSLWKSGRAPVSMGRNCRASALGIGLKDDPKAFCLVLIFSPAHLLRQTAGQNS